MKIPSKKGYLDIADVYNCPAANINICSALQKLVIKAANIILENVEGHFSSVNNKHCCAFAEHEWNTQNIFVCGQVWELQRLVFAS